MRRATATANDPGEPFAGRATEAALLRTASARAASPVDDKPLRTLQTEGTSKVGFAVVQSNPPRFIQCSSALQASSVGLDSVVPQSKSSSALPLSWLIRCCNPETIRPGSSRTPRISLHLIETNGVLELASIL
jgi:hypothetical protein